jgi:hypothetical protein
VSPLDSSVEQVTSVAECCKQVVPVEEWELKVISVEGCMDLQFPLPGAMTSVLGRHSTSTVRGDVE